MAVRTLGHKYLDSVSYLGDKTRDYGYNPLRVAIYQQVGILTP